MVLKYVLVIVLIKSFDFKMYLDNIKKKIYRFALTKFRLSSHELEIETGRGKQPVKTPISDRKCKLCNTIEDEFHVLLT